MKNRPALTIVPGAQNLPAKEQVPEKQDIIEQSTGARQIGGFIAPYFQAGFVVSLLESIGSLENKMKKLEGSFNVNTISINTLGSSKWELKQPLNVGIEQREAEDFVACLYDVNVYGYGDTIPEALEDLKMAMINQFERLIEQESKVQFWKLLKKQFEFLKNILVEKNVLFK